MVVSSIKTEAMHLEQITNVKESHGQTALQEPPTFPHRSTEYVHTHTPFTSAQKENPTMES